MSVEVFSAVMLNLKIKGNVQFRATDIGAEIYGIQKLTTSQASSSSYISISGSGETKDNVYYESGKDYSYSGITADVGTIQFTDTSDTFEMYMFVKNVGSRYIVPSISISSGSSDVVISTQTLFFDTSAGQIDPLDTKSSSSSASDCLSTVQSAIDAGNCGTFSANSSIDNNDVFVLKATCTVQNSTSIEIRSAFTITISFASDSIYQSDDILSVYQEQNISSSAWTKFGYNATLEAKATKVEENNMSNLEHYLRNKDGNGNADVTYGTDNYSELAPVYKDIDIVNIDIATGEIIGKLSDTNYDFEWFGRAITLTSGTTLASGRTLTQDETFTVDVYTYYPTMYIRRWVVGNTQWLSVSDKAFQGAVKIDEYYTATFESTMFNADKTVAYNDFGIIPRSYVYDHTPITSGSVNYLITNYGYTNTSSYSATESTTQANMLKWCSNLTKQWEQFKTNNPSFAGTCAKSCGGEDYTLYAYNILYLIKYANNDSQATVGYGNTYTYSLYNTSGVTVTTDNGNTITTGGNDSNSRYESEKGGGTIGLYNGSVQNNAKMAYGYQSEYQDGTDKQGLYAPQFLTYSNGTKRYLCDGYVGSDKYTSVFCLGQCNPWGNIWTWMFGGAVISDGTNVYMYIQLEHYDYEKQNYITSSSSGYENNKSVLENAGYVCLSYNLPSSGGYYNYLGTSTNLEENELIMLVGMQTSTSKTGGGLADYYYVNNTDAYRFGVLRGGSTYSFTYAGAFYFSVTDRLTLASTGIGLRA